MKRLLFIVVFLPTIIGFSQTKQINNYTENEVVNNEFQEPSMISYAKELPKIDSYQIVKNTSGSVLSDEILKMVNYHRRLEDYLWVVNSDIEILVLKFNK